MHVCVNAEEMRMCHWRASKVAETQTKSAIYEWREIRKRTRAEQFSLDTLCTDMAEAGK